MSYDFLEQLGRSAFSRRDLLRYGGMGIGAFTTGGFAQTFSTKKVDVHIQLIASNSTAQILSGAATNTYRYTARLLSGPRQTLRPIFGSFLGPTIHLWKGQRVRVDFYNQLAEDAVVHFHGLEVPHSADGHPLNTVAPGGTFRHEFEVVNNAGTYWYHTHTDMRTGFQVNKGLAGLIIIHEPIEEKLGLPSGNYDIPIVMQDRRFNTSNQFMHSTGSQTGFLGDKILINGFYAQNLSVGTRPYRLRLLNGCNSRILKVAWDNAMPMTVIGTDGGLLNQPVTKPYLVMSPGQRRDVWVDFGQYGLGTQMKLVSQAFDRGGPGSGMPAQGTPMDLLDVTVNQSITSSAILPSSLASFPIWQEANAVNVGNARTFGLEYMGMWTINGNTFELNNYTNDEIVQMNQLEVWEVRNDLIGALEQPHPMHFHGPQFQVCYRQNTDPGAWYDTIKDGYVDEGWQDTILAFPRERVKILTKWTRHPGLFLYHCHNLEHEDMGMMRNLYAIP
jgi:FtsP/CotA-like multicopper oxidase with cupredoxin domain